METENKDKYISLMEASALCDYSKEYLSLRARQKKLKAVKLGRNWVTTKEWLDDYITKTGLFVPGQIEKPVESAQPAVKKETLELVGMPETRMSGDKLKNFWHKPITRKAIGALSAFESLIKANQQKTIYPSLIKAKRARKAISIDLAGINRQSRQIIGQANVVLQSFYKRISFNVYSSWQKASNKIQKKAISLAQKGLEKDLPAVFKQKGEYIGQSLINFADKTADASKFFRQEAVIKVKQTQFGLIVSAKIGKSFYGFTIKGKSGEAIIKIRELINKNKPFVIKAYKTLLNEILSFYAYILSSFQPIQLEKVIIKPQNLTSRPLWHYIASVLLLILIGSSAVLGARGELTYNNVARLVERAISGVGGATFAVLNGDAPGAVKSGVKSLTKNSFRAIGQIPEAGARMFSSAGKNLAETGQAIGQTAQQIKWSKLSQSIGKQSGLKLSELSNLATIEAKNVLFKGFFNLSDTLSDMPKLLQKYAYNIVVGANRIFVSVSDMGTWKKSSEFVSGKADNFTIQAFEKGKNAGLGVKNNLSWLADNLSSGIRRNLNNWQRGIINGSKELAETAENMNRNWSKNFEEFKGSLALAIEEPEIVQESVSSIIFGYENLGRQFREKINNKILAGNRIFTKAKNHFVYAYNIGLNEINQSYGQAPKNIVSAWQKVENGNQNIKDKFDSGVYLAIDKGPRILAEKTGEFLNGLMLAQNNTSIKLNKGFWHQGQKIKIVSEKISAGLRDYGLTIKDGARDFGAATKEGFSLAGRRTASLARGEIREFFGRAQELSLAFLEKIPGINISSLRKVSDLSAAIWQKAGDSLGFYADKVQQITSYFYIGTGYNKLVEFWYRSFYQSQLAEQAASQPLVVHNVPEQAAPTEPETASEEQPQTTEITQIVQPTTEITKTVTQVKQTEKIVEIRTETISSAVLDELKKRDDELAAEIKKVSGDLSYLSGKFSAGLSTASNAPLNVGSSGFSVSGNTELRSAGVSEDLGVARDLTVSGNTTLGNSAGDTLTINAQSRFNALAVFASGLTITGTTSQATFGGGLAANAGLDVSGGNLTVGGTNFVVDTSGNLSNAGNTTLGNATSSDIVVFNSRINSGIQPSYDNLYDLGDGDNWLRWRTGYFGTSVGIGGTATTSGQSLLASGSYLIDTGGTFSINTTNNQPIIFGSGNIGIGTSSPYAQMSVWGSGIGADLLFNLVNNASTTLLSMAEDGNLNIPVATATTTIGGGLSVAGSSGLTVLQNGNIGIGTMGPAANLHLLGAGTTQLRIGYDSSNYQNLTVQNDGSLFFAQNGGLTALALVNGNVGIGTTSPFAKLQVAGNNWPQLLLSDSSAGANLKHWYASSTLGSFAFGTLNDSLSILSEKMRIDSNGNLGIGTTSPSQKLSVNGSAYITGGLGVGLATTTPGVIETSGNVLVGGDLEVRGNSIVIGNSFSGTLTVNTAIVSNLVPDQNAVRNLGSPAYYWDSVYADHLVANNISAASTTIAGTQSASFTINSDNATADTEDMDLIFFRGTVVPNALISWDSGRDLFDINQSVFLQNDSSTTTVVSLDVHGSSGQTANLFRVSSYAGDNYFNITNNGNVGIGTSSPYAKFSVAGNAVFDGTLSASTFNATSSISAPYFTATSATATSTFAGGFSAASSLYVLQNGNVGVGTISPLTKLHVEGQCVTGDTLLSIVGDQNTDQNSALRNFLKPSFTRIDEIKGGEMVMSLDEKTGKIVPAKIKGLLDMGVKPIFKLTTEDGRTIRTTGNHPYLTKNGWTKVVDLEQGELIAAPKDDLFASFGQDANESNQDENQGAKNININHSVGNIHNSDFDYLDKNKLIDQADTANIKPKNNTSKLDNPLTNGSINTDAKKTCPISRLISDKTFNFSDENSIYDNNSNYENDVKWVEIASIEYVGEEQVYDIEVEGTHNFVANGIIAHNTYISGNVGINNSSPVYALDVNGALRTASNAFFDSNTTLGNATSSDLLTFNSRINSGIHPNVDNFLDIGDGENWLRWRTGYFGTSVGIAGTATTTGDSLTVAGAFTINSKLDLIASSTSGNLIFATNGLERMRVVSAGNVGIGTTSPWAKLAVDAPSGQNAFIIGSTTTSFIVDKNGYVGIGTAEPARKMEISDSGYRLLRLTGSNDVGSVLEFNPTATGGLGWEVGAMANGSEAGGGKFAFVDSGSNTRMVIDSVNGNVGIGTTSPSYLFHVQGNGTQILSSNFYATGQIVSQYNGAGLMFGRDSSSAIGTIGGSDLGFWTNMGTAPFEVLHLKSSGAAYFNGNVGIGTTSPSAKLSITGAGTTTGRAFAVADSSNVEKFTILDNGNVGVGTASPGVLLEVAGTGKFTTSVNANTFYAANNNTTMMFNNYSTYSTANRYAISVGDGTNLIFSQTSGSNGALKLLPKYNQVASTADNTDLLINRTETSLGTGAQYLINAGTGGGTYTSKFNVTNTGQGYFAGNVGIGTTTPNSLLHVSGTTPKMYLSDTSASANQKHWFMQSTGGSLNIGTTTDGLVDTSSYRALTILQNGNVGIGTTSPGSLLHLYGTDNTKQKLTIIQDATSGTNAANVIASDAYGIYVASGLTALESTSAANYRGIEIAGNGTVLNGLRIHKPGSVEYNTGINGTTLYIGNNQVALNGTRQFVLDNAGNVGIGTTSPSQLLHIQKDSNENVNLRIENQGTGTHANAGLMMASNSSDVYMAAYDDGYTDVTEYTDKFVIQTNGTNIALSAYGASDEIQFYTGGRAATNRRLTINSSGNVGIGTTSPFTKLSVSGNGYFDGTLTASTFTATSSISAPYFTATSATATSTFAGGFSAASSFYVLQNGNVGIGTTSPGAKLDVSVNVPIETSGLRISNQWVGGYGTVLDFYGTQDFGSNLQKNAGRIQVAGEGNWGSDAATDSLMTFSTIKDAVLTEQMRITSGGNVGIGTTSPASKLAVAGNMSIGSSFLTAAPTNGLIVQGNVGIGTTTPSNLLTLNATGGAPFRIQKSGGSGGLYMHSNVDNEFVIMGGWEYNGTSDYARATGISGVQGGMGGSGKGTIGFYAGEGLTVGNVFTPSNYLRMQIVGSTGHVGIGGSPSYRLSVNSGTASSIASFLAPSVAGVDFGEIYFGKAVVSNQAGAIGYNTSGGYVFMQTYGDPWGTFVIKNGGNVGIGTTTPNSLLHVSGTTPKMYLSDTSASANQKHWFMQSTGGSLNIGTTTDGLVDTSSYRALTILQNGNVGIGTTNPGYKLDVQGGAVRIGSGGYTGGTPGDLVVSREASPTTGAIYFGSSGTTNIYAGSSFTFNSSGGILVQSGVSQYTAIDNSGGARFYQFNASGDLTNLIQTNGVSYLNGGNVGIGTTSPQSLLHIHGDYARFTNSTTGSGSGDGGWIGMGSSGSQLHVWNIENDIIRFGTNNTEQVRITSAGNVGIGTTNPGSKLEVNGSATGSNVVFKSINTATNTWLGGFDLNAPNMAAGNTNYFQIGKAYSTNNLAAVGFQYNGAGSTSNLFNFWFYGGNPVMSLTAGGNVGIGTTSPGAPLHIQPAYTSGGSTYTAKLWDINGSAQVHQAAIFKAGNPAVDGNANDVVNSVLSLGTIGGVSLITAGNVGIGTTNPLSPLHVKRATSGDVLDLQIYNGGASEKWINFLYSDAGLSYGNIHAIPNGIAIEGGLTNTHIALMPTGSGNVGIGTTSPSTKLQVDGVVAPNTDNAYTTGNATYRWSAVYAANGTIQTSDIRLKDNITNLNYGLNEIMQLRPVSFAWKDNLAQGTHLGLIAQEVQPIIPEVVDIGDDANHTLGIRYENLAPVLIKGLQQLNALVSPLYYGAQINSGLSTTTPFMVVDEAGNVGIGSSTPSRAFSVAKGKGAAIAEGWEVYSSEKYKKDIEYLKSSDYGDVLEKISAIQVATYRYNDESENSKLRIGLIAEEAPEEILSAKGDSVSLYDLTSFVLAGVKAQQKQIEALRIDIEELKAKAVTLESLSAGSEEFVFDGSFASIINAFRGLGAVFKSGIARFQQLVVKSLVIEKNSDSTRSAVGEGVIVAGQTEYQIESSQIKIDSKIFITWRGDYGSRWWIDRQAEGEAVVKIAQPMLADVRFDWLVVGVETAEPFSVSAPVSGPEAPQVAIPPVTDQPPAVDPAPAPETAPTPTSAPAAPPETPVEGAFPVPVITPAVETPVSESAVSTLPEMAPTVPAETGIPAE